MEVLKWVLTGMFFASLLTAITVGFVRLEPELVDQMLQDQNTTLEQKGGAFIGLQMGLKGLTPAYRKNWLPNHGALGTDYIPLIEEFPLPDEIDAIGFIFMFLPLFFLIRWETEGIDQFLLKLLLLVLIFLFVYITAKVFYYWLYYASAETLGLPWTVTVQLKETQLGIFESMIETMGILAVVMFTSASLSIVSKLK